MYREFMIQLVHTMNLILGPVTCQPNKYLPEEFQLDRFQYNIKFEGSDDLRVEWTARAIGCNSLPIELSKYLTSLIAIRLRNDRVISLLLPIIDIYVSPDYEAHSHLLVSYDPYDPEVSFLDYDFEIKDLHENATYYNIIGGTIPHQLLLLPILPFGQPTEPVGVLLNVRSYINRHFLMSQYLPLGSYFRHAYLASRRRQSIEEEFFSRSPL